jgi:hypothetical protein
VVKCIVDHQDPAILYTDPIHVGDADVGFGYNLNHDHFGVWPDRGGDGAFAFVGSASDVRTPEFGKIVSVIRRNAPIKLIRADHMIARSS